MKTPITHHLFDESDDEEMQKKNKRLSNLLMSIFIVFTIALVSMIYSCMVPGPGMEGPGGNRPHHGNSMSHANNNHDEHHD
jgi:hypothetical protein